MILSFMLKPIFVKNELGTGPSSSSQSIRSAVNYRDGSILRVPSKLAKLCPPPLFSINGRFHGSEEGEIDDMDTAGVRVEIISYCMFTELL